MANLPAQSTESESGASSLSPLEREEAYQLFCHCLICFIQERPLRLEQTPWKINPPWQAMVDLAQSQGCINLIYKVLEAEPADTLPAPVLTRLRQMAQQQTAISMKLIQSLAQVLQLFEQNDIAVIAYKGPMLAQVIYGDIGLRCFSDLDLWVAPQDFDRARQLLIDQAGYHIADRTWTFLTPRGESTFVDEEGECALVNGIVHVDLHCRLAPIYFLGERIKFEAVWQRSEPISCLGLQVHTLSSEDRLIYLCIHGSKEHWRSLKWVMDLAMTLKTSPNLDWEIIAQRAAEWHCERLVMLGLCLVSQAFGASLPPQAQPLLAMAYTDKKLEQLLGQLLKPEEPAPSGTKSQQLRPLRLLDVWSPWRVARFQLAGLRDRGDRWRYGLHRLKGLFIPNSKDQAFLPLPPLLYPLYYCVRPLRLLFKRVY